MVYDDILAKVSAKVSVKVSVKVLEILFKKVNGGSIGSTF